MLGFAPLSTVPVASSGQTFSLGTASSVGAAWTILTGGTATLAAGASAAGASIAGYCRTASLGFGLVSGSSGIAGQGGTAILSAGIATGSSFALGVQLLLPPRRQQFRAPVTIQPFRA